MSPYPARRRPVWPLLLLMLVIGALIYWWFAGGDKEDAAAPPPSKVTVMTLQETAIDHTVELPGRITATRMSEVRPQVDGILQRRLFTEGSVVKEGTPLYQIDAALYEATYNSARADLVKAEATARSASAKAKRFAQLVRGGAVSRQDYDDALALSEQARADVGVAKANLDTARINLDYTRVRAPITGRIAKSNMTEGALVTANQTSPLTMITQLDPVYVDLTQSDRELAELRQSMQGQSDVPVTLLPQDSAEPYPLQGKLAFSEVTVDPTTGSVQMRAIFPNPDHRLLPGLFVRARISLPDGKGILIPQQAAPRAPDGSASVWVVGPDNKVQPVKITILRAEGSNWVVRNGVNSGDTIVMEGFQKIMPGATVETSVYGAPKEPTPPPGTKP